MPGTETPAETPRQDNQAAISRNEYDIRRFEAIMKVVSVVLGTMVVGLAGVLVPGVINSWTLDLERQKAYQAYITSFVEKGINQDIELRLRLAGYFANLSTADQKKDWQAYESQLRSQRDGVRKAIDEEEAELARLCAGSGGIFKVAKIDEMRRWLEWHYTELGYAQPNRSAMPPSLEAVERRRLDLYVETKSIVQKLAASGANISRSSADYRRFWELYRRDLIGIESAQVAQRMIALGKSLEALLDNASLPAVDFGRDANAVVAQIDQEMTGKSTQAPLACTQLRLQQ